MDRVRFGAKTAGRGSRRAPVGRPYGPAVAVDGHAVGATPLPSLRRLRPIPNYAIGIGAAVDGLDSVRLRRASPLLPLSAGCLQCNADDDDQRSTPKSHET